MKPPPPPPHTHTQVDIYSLGCIMYYLFHGEPPFAWLPPLEACRAAAVELKRPALRPTLEPELAALISACWHPAPAARPSAREIGVALERAFPDAASATFDPVHGEGKCCEIA